MPQLDSGGISSTLKDLKLSNEEVSKFEKAFSQPEFLKMFEEHIIEMQDPKARAETEEYLRQLELEGKAEETYGKGAQLIVPQPEFVVKSKNLETADKVYINVCSSDKVGRATEQRRARPDGSIGTHVSIPLVSGTGRKGSDGAGRTCCVWDFVVHPETIARAESSSPHMSLLVDTALDEIEKVGKIKLSRTFRRLNMKFKVIEGSDKPKVMCLRPDASQAPSTSTAAAPATSSARNGNSAAAGPARASQQSKIQVVAPTRRTDLAKQARDQDRSPAATPGQAGFRHPTGEVTPRHEVVHRGVMDLVAAWGDAGHNLAVDTARPKELVVRVWLPGMSSAAGVDLQVDAGRLQLAVPGRYKLEAVLPYPVDGARGAAKFDKAKQCLNVTVPVLPPARPAATVLQPSSGMSKGSAESAAGCNGATGPVADATARAETAAAGGVVAEPAAAAGCSSGGGIEAAAVRDGDQTQSASEMRRTLREGDVALEVPAVAAAQGAAREALAGEHAQQGEQGQQQDVDDDEAAAAAATAPASAIAGPASAAASITEMQRRWMELHAQSRGSTQGFPTDTATAIPPADVMANATPMPPPDVVGQLATAPPTSATAAATALHSRQREQPAQLRPRLSGAAAADDID